MAAAASANDKKIFVGNLDFGVTENELKLLFEASVGPVEGVNIRRDRDTKRPKGFAFITFESPADAKRALDTMQSCIHRGRTLTIKPQIARGTQPEGGTRTQYKKPTLWGDKTNNGWYSPATDDSCAAAGSASAPSAAAVSQAEEAVHSQAEEAGHSRVEAQGKSVVEGGV